MGDLKRVGALWKPREGAKSKGSGSITVDGMKQRFVILPNDKKREGSKDPDYLLMSGDEPERDEYARRNNPGQAAPSRSPAPRPQEPERMEITDDDVPF